MGNTLFLKPGIDMMLPFVYAQSFYSASPAYTPKHTKRKGYMNNKSTFNKNR
jgi:hypothetical protein